MRKTNKLLAALTLLLTLPALALAADFAVVRGGRLNLRQYPSSSSQSLGKYDSGSWVDVQGQGASGWYAVRTMDGKTGYMAGNYLTFAQSGSIGTVAYANGGYVNLRRGPSLDYAVVTRVTSGTTISILDASYEWNYVSATVNGATYTGYMHDSLIIKSTTTATVSTRNGGKVNVRRGPSSAYGSIGSLKSGTRVTVLLKDPKTGELTTSRMQISEGRYDQKKNLDLVTTSFLTNPMTWFEGKQGSTIGYINQWQRPIMAAGDSTGSDTYMLESVNVERGGIKLWINRKPGNPVEDKKARWTIEHADKSAAEQNELNMPVTANKNWIFIDPDTIM